MTSGIILKTNLTIALAADSTVTIDDMKSYSGVDKIFKISNQPPLAGVIYGCPEFGHTPMETLIKKFGKEFDFEKNSDFETIPKGFIQFMGKNTEKTDMNKYILDNLYAFEEMIEEELYENGEIDPPFEYNIPEFLNEIYKNHGVEIKLKKLIPPDISKSEKNKMMKTLKERFLEFLTFDACGVVFTGFGKHDMFGSVIKLELYFNYDGEIKFNVVEKEINDYEPTYHTIAQKDEIKKYLTGFDEETKYNLANIMNAKFEKDLINLKMKINKNPDINKNCRDNINKEIDDLLNDFKSDENNILNYLTNYQNNEVTDILYLLNALPKYDLANLAENLINITSLKQKITYQLETVGGFVDVAIITKGDGFNWVKHKGDYEDG